jgi:hypothetical protein
MREGSRLPAKRGLDRNSLLSLTQPNAPVPLQYMEDTLLENAPELPPARPCGPHAEHFLAIVEVQYKYRYRAGLVRGQVGRFRSGLLVFPRAYYVPFCRSTGIASARTHV